MAFNAFHSGLQVACIAGAGVAVLGALAAAKLLPGRGAPEVQLAGEAASSGSGSGSGRLGLGSDRFDPDRYPEYVPYVSA